ncbi:MAG: hypothetical protein ACYTGP_09225, partial [Planctomycetota bacterium]
GAPADGPGGACCLGGGGCQNVGDEAACATLGGVLLEGEDCATDPCAVGACCSQDFCFQADAFSCITSGRDFIGAGLLCSDDPCETGLGACCLGGDDCQDLSSVECDAMAGTWLGFGTNCIINPCEQGACCAADDTCTPLQRYECEAVAGRFIGGVDCTSEPCVKPTECPDGTIFGKSRDEPLDDFLAGTSEESTGFRRFQKFESVPGLIERLTWWGVDLGFSGGFFECAEADPSFDITIHRDAGGAPGEAVCSYSVVAVREPQDLFYNGTELNKYTVELPFPCAMVHGWISIVGKGDPDCWFLWMSSGDDGSWCDGCQVSQEGAGLSICLEGVPGGVPGACCDDDTGTCLDGVDIADCTALGQRFVPVGECDLLDPPCGIVPGACCFADDPCSIELEDDCAAMGGTWLGRFSECEQCPCNTPCPAGASAEGEFVCFDEYDDTFNSGCVGSSLAFSSIEIGETVCGTSGLYALGSETVGDWDWYEVIVAEATTLTFRVSAEFVAAAFIMDGSAGCPGEQLAGVAAFECDPIVVSVDVPQGLYWCVVTPFANTDTGACGARYVASLNVTPECPMDIDGSGDVGFSDAVLMIGAWGECPGCPEDLDDSGSVDALDMVLMFANWGPCPE